MEKLHSDIESVRILTELLVQKEIHDIVLSPGSRNAPLLVSVAKEKKLRHFVIPDERSAAFFALGIAQQSQRTVALICTSGTALLNYAPAIAEAYYQGIPLLVISADRPPEWIDQDDSQTIRQNNILTPFVKYSCQLPVNIVTPEDRWYANRLINEAINASQTAYKGPVHVNIPLREPLYGFHSHGISPQRIIRVSPTRAELLPDEKAKLQGLFSRYNRILLIVGFHTPDKIITQQIEQLILQHKVVVLTENIANKNIPQAIPTIDRVLATIQYEEESLFAPDLLITFGGAVVSRMIKTFIRHHPPREHWHIDLREIAPDTYQSLTLPIKMEARAFFTQLTSGLAEKPEPSDYFRLWKEKENLAEKRHHEYLSRIPWCDLKAFSLLLPALPANTRLQLGNSTPVRYAQLFHCNTIARADGNRGTSGIDGCSSTAVGASVTTRDPTILITGDIGFLYDSNALWIKYKSSNLKIVVIQNGGGGIFRFLPGPSVLDEVEEFFETPHQVDIVRLGELHGFKVFEADNEIILKECISSFFQPAEKPYLLVVKTPRTVNGNILKEYFKHLSKRN